MNGPHLVSVSGIDGAGKSSLIAALIEHHPNTFAGCPKFKPVLPGRLAEALGDGVPSEVQPSAVLNGPHADLYHTARAIEFCGYVSAVTDVDTVLSGPPIRVVDRWVPDWLAWARTTPSPNPSVELIFEAMPQPSLAVVLDCPVEIGLERIRTRGELHPLDCRELLEPFRRRLLALVSEESYPSLVLDASVPISQTVAAVARACADLELDLGTLDTDLLKQ